MDLRTFLVTFALFLFTYQINLAFAQTCQCPTSLDNYVNCTACGQGKICPNQDNNASFFFCTNNIWITAYCNAGGSFNTATQQCTGGQVTTTITTTPSSIPNPNPNPNPGTNQVNCNNQKNYATFPYPNSNTQYYVCINNQALLAQCPTNSIYNQATGTCGNNGYPNNGYPGYPGYPSYPGYPNNPGYPTYPGYPSYPGYPTYPGYPNYPNNPGYPNYPNSQVTCPSGANILLGIPNNCQSYVSCVNGYGTMAQCPMGLYFNPDVSACTQNMPMSCYYNGNGNNYYPNNGNINVPIGEYPNGNYYYPPNNGQNIYVN